ncbi:flagellar motor protein [Pyxidicoccus fallax]|uniref:Flagellar motor protein n=1 Tax=Pyxidicoccus fallax TaxID=394095 RepID=A0A848LBK2_9BACT|nr:flagellar motor protein [Pyxidicoccus fallax]NMO14073.1 flagellar motor protein [Pyxidicoccus fallax]NPC78119.1 flagellar motor protein [Pyxidicoccus fallax]
MRRAALLVAVALSPLGAAAQGLSSDTASRASTIAGQVCRDVDGNGQCGPDEPGLPDVRLVLSTGREARTDARGRYHVNGVDARVPDATGGLHLRPGRQRLKVDPRSLPAASRVSPEAATVEVPWGAVVLQDFAVRDVAVEAPPVVLSYASAPPVAELAAGGGAVRFLVAGQAAPGDRVVVSGVQAEVDAQGAWRALVPLVGGENSLAITATAPDGAVRLFRQRVDVVARDGGWLVAPRPMEPAGSLQLPVGRDEAAPSGTTRVRVAAPEGTVVRTPEGERRVGPQGHVEVPVALEPGTNAVPLHLEVPGEPPREETLEIAATARPFAVGLLDVEATWAPADGDVQLRGRGSAHAELRLGDFELEGELDLRDTDGRTLNGASLPDWLRPRAPERFERWADPDLTPAEWGDDSVSLTPNAPEGRLRLEARHERYGRAGLGSYRALMQDREVGRYHRPLFGPYAELRTGPEAPREQRDLLEAERTPDAAARAGVDVFGGSLADPSRPLAAVPAHEELRATGGSLYYLGAGAVAEGSELVRLEVRDGVTGLPLAEHHLVRGRDYDIDYFSGRILLARPLSFLAGESWLRTGSPTEAPEPVLVVDYAALRPADARDAAGGEVWAEWGGAHVGVGAVREDREGAPYRLYTGRASAKVGAYTLLAEVASSRGTAVEPGLFGVSDDGGLSFLRPGAGLGTGGEALGLRVRGPGPLRGGAVDAAFRLRAKGFSDGAHTEAARFRQTSVRVRQPLGRLRLTLLADERRSADPREPFADTRFTASTVAAGVGWEETRWGAYLELRDSRLGAAEVPGGSPTLYGGRTSAGLAGSLRLWEGVALRAAHRQALALHGEGLGRVDDTFTSAGVDVDVTRDTRVGVHGGWGPELGPRAWANVESRGGQDVYYGGYSVDVDGPDFGAGRTVTGARTELPDSGTALFVEDVGAHDTDAVRLARAVGLQQQVTGGFSVGARYERGVRSLLDVDSALTRDVAGVFGQLVTERLRVDGRVELRQEEGIPERGARTPVDRVQAVVALAAQAELREDVTASGRVDFARTADARALEARLLEGYAAVAWRPGPWLVVARYGVTRELRPGTRAAFGDRALHVFSLLPAVRLGDRLSVAAGLHAGRSSLEDSVRWVWTGSVRPAVRVVGGLEVGAELARRTASPEGERLTAVRAEVAYRVDERLRLAAGYTLLGFSGLGLTDDSTENQDRLYLRAEVAY